MKTKKQVAIKIMRVKNMVNKKECLECLFTEINILTECRHPNIVKILDASFDGMIIKEQKVSDDAQADQQQMFASPSSSQMAGSKGGSGGASNEADKVKDVSDLSIIEKVDNSSNIGIYYDEVDEMLAQQLQQ